MSSVAASHLAECLVSGDINCALDVSSTCPFLVFAHVGLNPDPLTFALTIGWRGTRSGFLDRACENCNSSTWPAVVANNMADLAFTVESIEGDGQ